MLDEGFSRKDSVLEDMTPELDDINNDKFAYSTPTDASQNSSYTPPAGDEDEDQTLSISSNLSAALKVEESLPPNNHVVLAAGNSRGSCPIPEGRGENGGQSPKNNLAAEEEEVEGILEEGSNHLQQISEDSGVSRASDLSNSSTSERLSNPEIADQSE